MNIMQGLEAILKQTSSPQGRAGGRGMGQAGDLFGGLSGLLREASGGGKAGLLGPAALGGLLGAMFSSETARTVAGGALLAGGGAALWNKYKDRLRQNNESSASPLAAYSLPAPAAEDLDGRALRLVRALVFAARSDGHVDAAEQRAIQSQLQQLNLGAQAQQAVNQAMADPLDPSLIAGSVQSADEALEVFTLSCAVIDPDQFMEKAYLDGLARALNIPDDVRDEMLGSMHASA